MQDMTMAPMLRTHQAARMLEGRANTLVISILLLDTTELSLRPVEAARCQFIEA